ncbi:MAG: 2-C-methyl-D-erythritol 4-phosphate cytidylyltransferase, partial [Candidatus Gracilibacteria bacterium]
MNKIQKKSTTSAVLLAGGKSSRIHGELKQWAVINNKPVFAYALNVFLTHPQVDQVVLVVRHQDNNKIKRWIKDNKIKGATVVAGGNTRQESAT